MLKVRKVNVTHWRLLTTHTRLYTALIASNAQSDLVSGCHAALTQRQSEIITGKTIKMKYLAKVPGPMAIIMSCRLSIIVLIENIANYNCYNSQVSSLHKYLLSPKWWDSAGEGSF